MAMITCVSRSGLKTNNIEADAATVSVTDNRKQKIELCRVNSDCNTDYYLKVESHTKELKERSMNQQFRSRFEAGLQQIADSLTKKGGVKQEDKVHERIGRLKQKYPSIQRYFDIETEVNEEAAPKRKKKVLTSTPGAGFTFCVHRFRPNLKKMYGNFTTPFGLTASWGKWYLYFRNSSNSRFS